MILTAPTPRTGAPRNRDIGAEPRSTHDLPDRRTHVTSRGPRLRDETGTVAIELTLLAPALLVVLLFVVGLGRLAHTSQQVESVAADAARAASLSRGDPQTAASSAAAASLGRTGLSCTGMRITLDTSRHRPGGSLSATVACTAQLGDVALAGFPGSRTFTATSQVPIETYRAEP